MFKKFIHFFYFFGVTQIRFSATDEYFCAFRKFNGDGAVPSLWQPRDVVACCTPAPLSRFIPSLFIAFIIRDVIRLSSPRCIPASFFSLSLSLALRKDTTATDKIYYKTCLLCSLFTLVYFRSGQSEKRNSSSDDKSSD